MSLKTITKRLERLERKWDPPKYKPVEKIPFIPTEKEIDEFIAGCGKKTATTFNCSKKPVYDLEKLTSSNGLMLTSNVEQCLLHLKRTASPGS